MWRDAHPDLALALLSDDEVDALAAVAQKADDKDVEINYPFDKSFDIVSSHGFTIGPRVRLRSSRFMAALLTTFISACRSVLPREAVFLRPVISVPQDPVRSNFPNQGTQGRGEPQRWYPYRTH